MNDDQKKKNPWGRLVLTALIALLIGTLVWGICGLLDQKIYVPVRAENGEVRVPLADGQQIDPDAPVTIGGKKFPMGPAVGGGAYSVSVDLPDGEYEAQVITERMAPITRLFYIVIVLLIAALGWVIFGRRRVPHSR